MSLVVSVVVLFIGIIGNAQLASWSSKRVIIDEYMLKEISGPNQYVSGITDETGFLSGRIEFNIFKIIEGVPMPWLTKKTVYNVLPLLSFTSHSGNDNGLMLSLPDPEMLKENFGYNRGYNGQNGQRKMAFYIPTVNYNDKVLNDLSIVKKINEEKLVEMAISFDKSYSLDEVQSMIPTKLTQVWYWVDTYDDKKYFEPYKDGNGNMSYATPVIDDWVYGFGIHIDGPVITGSEFINSLEKGLDGKYHYEFNRIYNYLKAMKDKPDKTDIRLYGVVLTATAKEIQKLSGQSYIRGAVLGAVVDKY
ncbi:anti sigma factor C-terminal domain-containing protein [Paenibacillus sp. CMAA1364]